MENTEAKKQADWKFYALLSGTAMSLLGGMYFLYSLFSSEKEIEISQEQKVKLEELVILSEQIKDSEGDGKKEPESTFAIKIFKQINELSEEMFLSENPNWIKERKAILKENKKAEYNSYCEKILAEKMRVESQASEMILQKLGMAPFWLQKGEYHGLHMRYCLFMY